jgi:hypothetical protein
MTVLVNPIEIFAIPSKPEDAERFQSLPRPSLDQPKFGKLLICHLSSANGVGIELFQFIEPKTQQRGPDTNFEYWKTGFFHIPSRNRKLKSWPTELRQAEAKRGQM